MAYVVKRGILKQSIQRADKCWSGVVQETSCTCCVAAGRPWNKQGSCLPVVFVFIMGAFIFLSARGMRKKWGGGCRRQLKKKRRNLISECWLWEKDELDINDFYEWGHSSPSLPIFDLLSWLWGIFYTLFELLWKKEDRNEERSWDDGFEECKEQYSHWVVQVLQIKVPVQRVFSSFSVLFMFMSKRFGD